MTKRRGDMLGPLRAYGVDNIAQLVKMEMVHSKPKPLLVGPSIRYKIDLTFT